MTPSAFATAAVKRTREVGRGCVSQEQTIFNMLQDRTVKEVIRDGLVRPGRNASGPPALCSNAYATEHQDANQTTQELNSCRKNLVTIDSCQHPDAVVLMATREKPLLTPLLTYRYSASAAAACCANAESLWWMYSRSTCRHTGSSAGAFEPQQPEQQGLSQATHYP